MATENRKKFSTQLGDTAWEQIFKISTSTFVNIFPRIPAQTSYSPFAALLGQRRRVPFTARLGPLPFANLTAARGQKAAAGVADSSLAHACVQSAAWARARRVALAR